jgi:hypothetical protein
MDLFPKRLKPAQPLGFMRVSCGLKMVGTTGIEPVTPVMPGTLISAQGCLERVLKTANRLRLMARQIKKVI